jgi:hypothetical protein
VAICSYCLKNNPTVDRNSFGGMCVECTNRSLSNDEIYKKADKVNKLLKS